MRVVLATFQAMDAAAASWACSAPEPPVADSDIHRETLQARGRLSCRETPRDKDGSSNGIAVRFRNVGHAHW